MITFKEFLKESQSPKITPSLGEIESYEWVTDKELMPDSVIDYLKRPIMWSYDNKSHNITKINSLKYLNDKCIVLCDVVLDDKEKVELKVYHGFGGLS